jgi:hypothetical protein
MFQLLLTMLLMDSLRPFHDEPPPSEERESERHSIEQLRAENQRLNEELRSCLSKTRRRRP